MNLQYPTDWATSLGIFGTQTLSEISLFLPKLLGAFLVLILGAFIAKLIKRIFVKLLDTLHLSSMVKNTPIEHFVANAEFGQKIEEILGSIVYWLIMLVVLTTSVSILGLQPVSDVLAKLLNYLPNIVSALLVLFFGTILAGLVESLVKGSIKTIDGHSSRLLGKVASYLVITIAIMAAISELGIARDFIMIMFIGFVAMLSLGLGLALGLGGQDVVRKVLSSWYERTRRDIQE